MYYYVGNILFVFVLKGIHPEWSSHQYREASMIVKSGADMFYKNVYVFYT